MYRKINIQILAAIFALLLAAVVITELVNSRRGGRSFKADLVEVTAEEVSSIEIFPKVAGGKMIRLVRQGDSWNVKSEEKTYPADPSVPGSLIEELNRATAESVVARKEDRWDQFEVTDSLGTRVKLFDGEKVLADLVIGKFSFSQPRKMTSYVRLSGEDEVYGVDGMLGMSFNRNLSSFRDKTVIDASSSDWTKLEFQYPADSSFTLQKSGDEWLIQDLPADSVAVAEYFSAIKSLNEGSFADDAPGIAPTHWLTIEGNNQMVPIEIKGYVQGEDDFMLESSQNPGNVFKSTDLAEKLFVPRSHFLE